MSTTATTPARIPWLDTTRGMAFLMVIYSHLDYCNSEIMKYFTPVFLTTFFFVSGYLFKENSNFMKVLEHRTRTILLPFVILSLFLILLRSVLTFHESRPLLQDLKGMLLQDGSNRDLWFVAALYPFSLIFYWIVRLARGGGYKLLLISLLLFMLNAVYSYHIKGPHIPWYIHEAGFACAYMGLGKWYRHVEDQADARMKALYLLPLLAIYLAAIHFMDLHVSYAGSPTMCDALLVTLIGLTLIIYGCKRFAAHNRLLLFVGANSLLYFAFHGKCYAVLQTLLYKVLALSQVALTPLQTTLMGFVITLADALILIIPVLLVNRFCPQILGRGFKLWKSK